MKFFYKILKKINFSKKLLKMSIKLDNRNE